MLQLFNFIAERWYAGQYVEHVTPALAGAIAVIALFPSMFLVLTRNQAWVGLAFIYAAAMILYGLTSFIEFRDNYVECQWVKGVTTYQWENEMKTRQTMVDLCRRRPIGNPEWGDWN